MKPPALSDSEGGRHSLAQPLRRRAGTRSRTCTTDRAALPVVDIHVVQDLEQTQCEHTARAGTRLAELSAVTNCFSSCGWPARPPVPLQPRAAKSTRTLSRPPNSAIASSVTVNSGYSIRVAHHRDPPISVPATLPVARARP